MIAGGVQWKVHFKCFALFLFFVFMFWAGLGDDFILMLNRNWENTILLYYFLADAE